MSGTSKPVADWTSGAELIAYQSCRACKHIWYFRRGFCPACGADDVADLKASGEGTVFAISIVTRAATAEARAHVPYAVVLVDAAEGFRMMGHGDRDLRIADRVKARFEKFTDHIVPYFAKV
ncbi:OB-fold domain-containing protein [Bradyrhizobium sp. LHD-71]|uniref:Zn-ribbon domain-containing OB-fold protein n=1 Tax=Bradyrhizobium sp. LHD-71 TaxID=3072141 RepID=UPI00280EFD65|nr:OB-fold domain-containing protein [Bradyrhizobium sp. LHD-71]MDQ8727803.1 OB-fold domain-containing protein [Bradyrhizobium sp. LHD-71]